MSDHDLEIKKSVEFYLVYSALIQAARHRGTVTYQELAHVLGLPLRGSFMGKRIGKILGTVSENEIKHSRPMLSAIAVNVEGKPGGGFFDLAREHGQLTTQSDDEFWQEQKKQIYHTWQQQFSNK